MTELGGKPSATELAGWCDVRAGDLGGVVTEAGYRMRCISALLRAGEQIVDDLTEATAMAVGGMKPRRDQMIRWSTHVNEYGELAGWERTSA